MKFKSANLYDTSELKIFIINDVDLEKQRRFLWVLCLNLKV